MCETAKDILEELIVRIPPLTGCKETIWSAYKLLEHCYKNGGKLLICGNGGSQADSEHIVGELMKSFLKCREIDPMLKVKLETLYPDGAFLAQHLQGALPAISLGVHTALTTAYSNDVSADFVFAQQVYGYGQEHDVLLALSTSGSSKNIIYALKVAKAMGIKTIGICGEQGLDFKVLCDCPVCVPSKETYRVQEYTLPIYHALCAMVELTFFSIKL